MQNQKIEYSIPAFGDLFVPMTNDFLFKMLMQENNQVLKEFVQDLLFWDDNSIENISITNPIHLGDTVTQKSIILDIEAVLNDSSIVNLEMQVIDFTLFEEAPEFYAKYMIMNTKNHKIYSDKFQIYVLDLRQIDKATSEEKKHRLDKWAMLFKATKWEELHMLAKDMPIIDEASKTVFELTAENQTRLELRARQDAIRRANDRAIYEQRQKELMAKTEEKLAELQSTLAEKDARIIELEKELELLKNQ